MKRKKPTLSRIVTKFKWRISIPASLQKIMKDCSKTKANINGKVFVLIKRDGKRYKVDSQ
jgi:hypothetical protein